MSASTDSTRYIFCEGKPGGPDLQLWSKLLPRNQSDSASFRILIVPMGGKDAAKNYAKGYTASSGASWRVIRDRDLDEESPDGEVVRWDEGRTLLTGLTCIESYALDPALLGRYVEAEHPKKLEDVDHAATLRATLQRLRDYQALRWALQSLRREIVARAKDQQLTRRAGTFDLPNRLTPEDGKIPQMLDPDSLLRAGRERVERFKSIPQYVNVDALDAAFERYRDLFDGEAFWTTGFRYWFHGKDVLKAWLSSEGYNTLVGYKSYLEWAMQNLNPEDFDDLRRIRMLCYQR